MSTNINNIWRVPNNIVQIVGGLNGSKNGFTRLVEVLFLIEIEIMWRKCCIFVLSITKKLMNNYLISEAIGDIAGSAYEGRAHRIKDYNKVKMFSSRAHFTDYQIGW